MSEEELSNSREEIEGKLDLIADIWNDFIWEFESCKRKINSVTESRTNYFGDMLWYFGDTMDIIFSDPINGSNQVSNHISLLQSIYIQQDFIEEFLRIFRVPINKGDLKKDSNYSMNRDIRNELVGHPIRRKNGNGALISSTLFVESDNHKINYVRYHRDNKFQFEPKEYSIVDIISRHLDFLNTYLEEVLIVLRRIIRLFIKEVKNLHSLVGEKNFLDVLNMSSIFFESINQQDFLYAKESLHKIYLKKDEHLRYSNVISMFSFDLKAGLVEYYRRAKLILEAMGAAASEFENLLESSTQASIVNTSVFHYELGKLSDSRNYSLFNMYSKMLVKKCGSNELVIQELRHMSENFHDEIEYYAALKLISKELNS